ncbi:MAG: threonine--tRNA ligase [Rickettsiaceae bacterium]
MINITFPDGSKKQFRQGITGFEIASDISTSLAKDAMVVEINGQLADLSLPIETDSSLKILTSKNPEVLEIIRHDAAHIVAEAAKDLFPDIQVTIGPAIKDGFYYDFAKSTAFTTADLEKIETRMRQIIKENQKFIREEMDRNAAIEMFKQMGEHYKAEIIQSIPEGEKITLYRQGRFVDLCRGPHCPSTGKIKHFKLMKVAGAYWRGDSKNEMLQRIYGTAWATKEQLDNYLYMLEEAEKRDHRKLGKELGLFHLQEEAQGMVFWHPKGYNIYRTIETYIRRKLEKSAYVEVKTPMMLDKKLWELSGHWEKFRENMFAIEENDKTHALKPMNCPCHVQIFKQGTKSYRDLPLRMAEFGCCHRNEATGGLHGLLRVRNFVQDDAHIFCTEEQINSETILFCKLLREVYNDFGFKDIKVKFSDRPEIRAGENSVWDKAESSLKTAIEETGFDYEMNPGEGAFYGPKLEFVLTDAVGRDWQCGTLQVDFVLPERLDAEYIATGGEKKRPVMLHRAIIGTFERFIGILIEQYAGRFPLWLAPIQIAIVGITNDLDEHIIELNKRFIDSGIRSELDISREKVNYKIRNFSNQKIPLIAIVGKKEQADGTLTIRKLGSSEEQETLSVDEVIKMINAENRKYLD